MNYQSEKDSLFEGWNVGVSGGSTHVVEKRQVLRNILGSPSAEKGVQQSLVAPVKRAMGGRVFHKTPKSFHTGTEDEDTRIETVGPSGVRGGRELRPVKKLVAVSHHHSIGVQKHAFGILSQAPTVKLGEGHAQFRSFQQGQIDLVLAVEQRHVHHLIKSFGQLGFHGWAQPIGRDHDDNFAGCPGPLEGAGQDQRSQGVRIIGGQSHPGLIGI